MVTYLGNAEDTVVLVTSAGWVTMELDADAAPLHVDRMKTLARAGEYDDVAFHRVIDGFVAQGGDVLFGDLEDGFDPGRVGTGDSSLPDLPLEPTDISFVRGVLGMARSSALDSANSQFFITLEDATFLDPAFDEDGNVTGGFTAFGEVIGGMDNVDALLKIDTVDALIEGTLTSVVAGVPDRMIDVFVADDLAPGRTSVGTDDAEKMIGGGKREAFIALDGDDTIKAKGGADYIAAGDGSDKVVGGGGRDEILSGNGKDNASGGAGADTINGGGGKDTLNGGAGDDVLDGGKGNDVVNGGAGDDTFVFITDDFGSDTIQGGFSLDQDIIDLRETNYLFSDITIEERDGDTHLLFSGSSAEIKIAGVTGLTDDLDLLVLV